MITFSSCMHGRTFQDFAADFLTALSEIYADNEILHLVYMRACKKAPSNRFTSKTAQKVMDRLKDIVITSTTMLFLTRIEDGTGITVRRMSEIPVYKVLFGSILVGKTFKSFETELADKLNDIFATEEQPMLISLQIDANEPVITIYTKTTQDVIDRVGLYIVTSKTKFRVCRTDGEDALNTTNTPKEEVEVPEETLPVTDNSTEDMCTLEEALELVDYDDSSVGSAAYKRILENSYYIIMREYRVIKKFDATEITYSLEFKDIWKDLDFADVLVELYNVFENVLRSVTAGLKGYDRIKVYIEHHSLQVPIGVHLMDVSEITADTILDAIERVLQSSKQLTFDGTLKIQIGVVRMPVVGGKRHYTYSAQDGTDSNEKHSIVTISKADNMCMARAILLGTAAIRDPKRYKELRYTYRSAQTIAARELLRVLGLKLNEKLSILDIPIFENHFNVQCIVVSCEDGNAIIYDGVPRREKVYLYKVGEHLDLIKNIRAFFCKEHFCDHCLKGYNSRHTCKISCPVCDHSPCVKSNEVMCNKCHYMCRSKNCFTRHRKPRKNKPSLCDTYWRCAKCAARLETNKCSSLQHKCGDHLCPNCKKYASVDHTCYIEYAAPTKSTDNYIFYDFETIQETGTHVPNLCIALKVCSECIDKIGICNKCGDGKNKYSSYYVLDYGVNTLDKFCKWLFSKSNAHAVCFAHNARGFDSHFIIEYLVKNSVKPEVIFSGSKIMSLKVFRGLSIRMYDSINYFAMGLKQLPKCFGIKDVAKGDFPHLFNRTENQKYVGKYPALHYYNVGRMKSPERSEFIAWYESVKDSEFDFKKELLSYCRKDVEILAKSCLKFRKLFMGASKVDPLQYITVASACMAAYKSKFCQELYDIDGKSVIVTGRQFPEGKSGTFIRSYFPYIKASVDIFSAASIRWLSWIAHTKNIKIIHACNEGEYRVPGSRYRLDGFHAETRTAYEFHSCMYHGCLFCYKNRGHMVLHLNQTVEELYRLTMLKKQFLLNKGYKYVCLWYHEYDVKRQSDEVFKSFVDNLDVVERLNPRDALYGGRTNAVRLHYKPKVDEKIEYVDFTSLYPYINKTRKYMTCPPVIITRDFQDISNYFGFVKCILLPPRRLLHPLIPYRMGGKLLFPLCKSCAEVGLYRKCKCSDADRCLKGTWATVEIQKALTLNYKIVKIYEIWDYPETLTYSQTSKGLFSDYINCFLKFKEESSGYPSTCVTIDEKELYKQQYFEREGVWLDEMCRNEGLRTVAKLSMNSLWGKFAQRSNMSQVVFCKTSSEFLAHLTDRGKIISDFKIISDEMIMLVYTKSVASITAPAFGNIPVASLTTSYARLHLYSIIEKLNERVLYFDTDSVIYIDRKGEWSPTTGPFLGELKDEVPRDTIIEYIAAGPKNYAYNTSNGKSVVKIRGITLNHDSDKIINLQRMKALIVDRQKYVDVPETKFVRSKKDFSIKTREAVKRYKFTYTKRMLLPDLTTLPYGY